LLNKARKSSDSDEDMLGCDEDPGQIGRVEEQRSKRIEVIPKKQIVYKKVVLNEMFGEVEEEEGGIEGAENEEEALEMFWRAVTKM